MSHRKIECAGCKGEFTVDEGNTGARCPRCGTGYEPGESEGWDSPTVVSSPLLDDEGIAAINAGGRVDTEPDAGAPDDDDDTDDAGDGADAPAGEATATQVSAPAGTTIRITIEILPPGAGGDP